MVEERKLIRLGNSSFAIALPKNWVTKSGLKKGDKVFIVPNSNGEIIISPEFKDAEEKKMEIDLKNKTDDSIKKMFHAAYTKGYNSILFKGDIKDEKKIKNLLNDYLSFEIIDSNGKEIIAKDFFNIKEAKFENFVRRIDNNLKEMFEIVLENIKKNKVSANIFKEIEEIDKAVNKFYFLCSRLFITSIDNPTMLNLLKMNGGKIFNHWWISFHLESLGDGLKYLLKWYDKTQSKNKEEVLGIFTKLQENYIKSMEAFYQDNSEKAFEIIQETKKLKIEIEKIEQKDSSLVNLTQSLGIIEKSIYQNAKMIFNMKI